MDTTAERRSIFWILRERYSFARKAWLGLAMSGMSILTYSSQELWGATNGNVLSNMNPPMFYLYVVLLTVTAFIINVKDLKTICRKTEIVVSGSIISLILDLSLLYVTEFFVLLTINQIPENLLRTSELILLIILPWSLGELTLTTVTAQSLKKRAKDLRKDIEMLKTEIKIIEKKRKEGSELLEELEKKTDELKKVFGKRSEG
jgi:hypothetical protein